MEKQEQIDVVLAGVGDRLEMTHLERARDVAGLEQVDIVGVDRNATNEGDERIA